MLLTSCISPTSTGTTHAGSVTAAPSTTVHARPGSLTALATLPVKGRAPKTGYARSQFGTAWTDDTDNPLGHNGCDT
ncbi:hypothetical protein [uncultured Jatrophihabitans sp.]|uniref:hypothetical protein n=1 Tax=uncultured Jatrophihabitans sp. TaxID=1610747 RepID=UPI0035CAA0EB